MVSALWFRWVTLNSAPGKRRKAAFGDFSHFGLCQDLVTAGLVTCGLVEALYLLGRVPPWCFGVKEGWKMPHLAKNGPFLCELHFFPQPGETETHGFYNISCPNDDAHLSKAVKSLGCCLSPATRAEAGTNQTDNSHALEFRLQLRSDSESSGIIIAPGVGIFSPGSTHSL